MQRTIWKYVLEPILQQEVALPQAASILSAGFQDGVFVLWAIVEPAAQLERRTILIIGTGSPMPERILRFIGTVQEASDTVWHIFEG